MRLRPAPRSAREGDVDVYAHRRVQPFFIGKQIEHALVGFVELLVRVVTIEGLLVPVELERSHHVRVAVVTVQRPVHGTVGVTREVKVVAELEQLVALAGFCLEAQNHTWLIRVHRILLVLRILSVSASGGIGSLVQLIAALRLSMSGPISVDCAAMQGLLVRD
jgi:hypothetical protein